MFYEIRDINSIMQKNGPHQKDSQRFLSLLSRIKPEMASLLLGNEDRLFVLYELFPQIGMYLEKINKKSVLVIGIDRDNVFDKVMLRNKNINFYGLDKIKYSDFNYPSDWAGMFFCDLSKKNIPIDIKFDCIIDYGVIGWHRVHDTLSSSEIDTYFDNIKSILTQDGLYFLKIDFHRPSKNTDYVLTNTKKNFLLEPFYGIEETIIYKDGKKLYHCFVLSVKAEVKSPKVTGITRSENAGYNDQ